MNPLELQDELAEELERLFERNRFSNILGEEVPIKVFKQTTPIPLSDEDEDEPIPYLIVHLNNGEQKVDKDSQNIVSLAVVVGIYDKSEENQGHRRVLDVLFRIQKRFSKVPNLGRSAFTGDFRWSVKDDGFYPYFFGVCELEFYIPPIRREDEFS